MRVLVTGAVGFIGGHLCTRLLDGGYEVVGVDNFDPFYDRRIKEEALRHLSSQPGFKFVEADIRDQDRWSAEMNQAEAAVHLAAKAGIGPSIDNAEAYASVNVGGTLSVLEAARTAGVRSLVFGSSSSVYGNSAAFPFREDAEASNPISPYAASKRAAELFCETYSALYGISIASLRFFSVYGPRQRPDLAIHKFAAMMRDGATIVQYGDGSTERDYTYVDDILDGVVNALKWTLDDPHRHEIFNLGRSDPIRLDEIISLLARALGLEPQVEVADERPGDVRRTCADISKAGAELGYSPKVSIEEGLSRFCDWFRTTDYRAR